MYKHECMNATHKQKKKNMKNNEWKHEEKSYRIIWEMVKGSVIGRNNIQRRKAYIDWYGWDVLRVEVTNIYQLLVHIIATSVNVRLRHYNRNQKTFLLFSFIFIFFFSLKTLKITNLRGNSQTIKKFLLSFLFQGKEK